MPKREKEEKEREERRGRLAARRAPRSRGLPSYLDGGAGRLEGGVLGLLGGRGLALGRRLVHHLAGVALQTVLLVLDDLAHGVRDGERRCGLVTSTSE